MISTAPSQFGPWDSQEVNVAQQDHFPLWIEAAWRDSDGTVFGWYHHEPGGICGSKALTAPRIGAVISYDGGRTIRDLGIVLESRDPPDCNSKNGFFAGGHGDFSVVLDRESKYFYFLFTNYGGAQPEQGIVTARLAFEDRFRPAGAVMKYYQGDWTQPGIGGRVTAIFPANRTWQRDDTDSFWGPSIHWNTRLNSYVVLMNRSCCASNWPQEGIYITFSNDVADPLQWKYPRKIMDGNDVPVRPGYYPQVLGLGDGETDSFAGEHARLYVHGVSDWEISFFEDTVDPVDPPPPPEEEENKPKPRR